MARRSMRYDVATFQMPKYRDYVVVELKYESPVVVERGRFVGREKGEQQAAALNQLVAKFEGADVSCHFRLPRTSLARSLKIAADIAAILPAAPASAKVARRIKSAFGAEFDTPHFFQSGFAQIVPKLPADAKKIAAALKRQAAVWTAHVAPLPVPPLFYQPPDVAGEGPFNLEPTQGYLYSAPFGIGATEAWRIAGGAGEGTTICDIEGGWNLAHEDLPRGIKVIGGTPITKMDWVHHGTAVLGEMVSLPNPLGTVGISHGAKAVVQSAFIDGVFNPAAAIDNAASRLAPGDVILIELHSELRPGKGDYVAMQYYPEVFTAIRAAVDRGVVIVEAAGNGNQNFDADAFHGSGLQKDCGAIVVGAGVPPPNRVDSNGFGPGHPGYTSLGVPRSRIFFSNYGQIVNVQGWGWHVTTTGYGDAHNGGPNGLYTLRFSGTSSASPIVVGAVACLQGAARKRLGGPLTPSQVRKILVATGTPQEDDPEVPAQSNHIGPQPDLVKAIRAVH